MELFNRIAIDPDVRFGKPCVRGTRITLGEVLGALASGLSETEVIAEFPQLRHEDLLACFAFAAERERRHMFVCSASAARRMSVSCSRKPRPSRPATRILSSPSSR